VERAPGLPVPDRSSGRRGLSWITWLISGVVVVAVAATVWLTTGSSAPAYRLVTVTTGSPIQTLDSVGTLTPINQANLNFGTSGTVASVAVTVGQVVTAGQALAALDTTSLQSAVVSAQATVAGAQAKVDADQSGQSSSVTASAALTSDITNTAAGPSPQPSSNPNGGTSPDIAQAQSTLVADQKQADANQQQATADLQQAVATCGASAPSTPPSTSDPSTTPPADTTPTTTPASPAPSSSTACTDALQQVANDQNAVSQSQATVASDETALAAILGSAASAAGSSNPGPSAPTGSGSSGGGTGGNGSSASGGSSAASSVATPQQLASDQAALDLATAQLASAQQDLADANLLSPIAGTVASVSIAAGAAVSAGSNVGPSSGAAIVILGPGSFVVTTNVAVTNIANVLVGQQATITPDATSKTIAGTVTSIGLVASTTSSPTGYPVTLSMGSTSGMQLTSGAAANVSIITKGATAVASVPSSAVQTVGTTHFVTEYQNGTTSRVRVTLGTVGDILTQITGGVKPGATVVLADLNLPIPASSATTTGRTGIGGAGGLSGTGGLGGGGGFGGGGGVTRGGG
jgi:multidrug efflux pump subunit AcrA (membrane-fusion protein)